MDNFKDHPVFQTIERIKNRLNSQDSKELKNFYMDEFIPVVEYFNSRFLQINYPLSNQYFKGVLDRLNNAFTQISNELNNYSANNNYGHLNNAKNQIINIVNLINSSFPIYIPDESGISNTISNYKSLIHSEFEKFNKTIGEIDSKLQTFKQQVTSIDTKFQEKNNQLEQLITNFKNQFEQLKQNLNKEIVDEKNKTISESEKFQKELNKKLEEAKKIVNIIGNIGITGDYQKNAEYHRKQANLWRWISIGFMIISIVYLSFTVWKIGQYEWHVSLLRILSTLLFIYPAQYCAMQSKIHRDQELFNKKMELDLAAINPFIELFDEKKKQEIKEKLVDKYFSNNMITNKTESDIPITIYEKIVNQIINVIKSLRGIGG